MRLRLPIAALFALAMTGAAAAQPRVVASIAPVNALVAGVMGEVGTPTLLVEGFASPHDYALRPSQARAVAEADLVFWIGPELEGFLVKPLASLDPGRAVPLIETDGLRLLPLRAGGAWEPDDHAGHGAHDEEEAHGEGARDPHLWLDPANAVVLVRAVAARLAEADPANAAAYRANADALAARIEAFDAELARRLAPVGQRPFIVFHDAYQYLESRYGLAAVGAITLEPDQRPGARRIREIRDRIRETGAACVFAEPQFEPALVHTVVEGTGARVGTLDPEGAGIGPGAEGWFRLMDGLVEDLAACLAG